MQEFELIRRFFQRDNAEGTDTDVILGIGDDAALLQLPAGQQLAVSVDTLVAGVHFPLDADAEAIAERALRVNLSDLAAMGAEPKWFTLALTLPDVSEEWLRAFSRGLFRTASAFNCTLVGGDTTAGPLSITVQVMGAVEPHLALRRDGASPGDYILVTNYLGDGAAALAIIEQRLSLADEHQRYLRERFYQPQPRLHEARLIRGLASAALDVSDGLVADLGHICRASDLAAVIYVEDLPLSSALLAMDDLTQARCWALSGGDDYELCFTVGAEQMSTIGRLIAEGKLQATVIGEMLPGSGVHCELDGEPYALDNTGYQHFSA